MWTANTRGCPGWYESSLGAHVILLVLSWCGSDMQGAVSGSTWYPGIIPVSSLSAMSRLHVSQGAGDQDRPWPIAIPLYMSPVKRICVFEHSVMTHFNCACPAIQRGQGSGFLSEGFSWVTASMSEQRRFWRDCADAQARLNLRCSHRR